MNVQIYRRNQCQMKIGCQSLSDRIESECFAKIIVCDEDDETPTEDERSNRAAIIIIIAPIAIKNANVHISSISVSVAGRAYLVHTANTSRTDK